MKIITQTSRLLLREFLPGDAQFMYALNNDPEVLKYTGNQAFKSLDEAANFLKNYSDYKRNGFGRWVVILKETGDFIGWCGLKLNEEDQVDIGFRFFKKYWNKGYATEAARACLEYGFSELGIDQIIGRAMIENKASIRVLEKLGMQYWKIQNVEGLHNAAYYIIKKPNT